MLRRAAALGLTCYDLPAAYGGGGVESLRERCEVIEELAWGDSPIFWVIAQGGFFAGAAARARLRRAEAALAAAALQRRAAGLLGRDHRARARLRRGRDRDDRRPRATAATSSNGRKKFIGNGHIADVCIVFATVEPGSRSRGITAFVVENGDDGLRPRAAPAEDGQPLLPGRARSRSRTASSPRTAASARRARASAG